MTTNKNEKLRILVECALLCAMSCVLSIFPKFKFLAQGGSITVCSMLPIILASYRRGIKWGLLTALAFALFQILTGFQSAGIDLFTLLFGLAFDYIIAFTVLGFGGMFRGKLGSAAKELCLGGLIVMLARMISHIVSGAVLYGEYADWFFGELGSFGASVLGKFSGASLAVVYSIIYNASYMIPEMIITTIVAALISKYALLGIEPAKTAK